MARTSSDQDATISEASSFDGSQRRTLPTLMVWAPVASNVYHDSFWYPTTERSRIRSFMRTVWEQLFREY